MSWIDLAALVLAAHRAWVIWFVKGSILSPLRDWLVQRGGKLGYLAGCPLCVSVWVGALIYGSWLTGAVGQFVVWALALSSALSTWNTANQVMEKTFETLERKVKS